MVVDQETGGKEYEKLPLDRSLRGDAGSGMYIHRSTFLHRLKRIQELTHINFDNTMDRVWLTLSFFISPAEQ